MKTGAVPVVGGWYPGLWRTVLRLGLDERQQMRQIRFSGNQRLLLLAVLPPPSLPSLRRAYFPAVQWRGIVDAAAEAMSRRGGNSCAYFRHRAGGNTRLLVKSLCCGSRCVIVMCRQPLQADDGHRPKQQTTIML